MPASHTSHHGRWQLQLSRTSEAVKAQWRITAARTRPTDCEHCMLPNIMGSSHTCSLKVVCRIAQVQLYPPTGKACRHVPQPRCNPRSRAAIQKSVINSMGRTRGTRSSAVDDHDKFLRLRERGVLEPPPPASSTRLRVCVHVTPVSSGKYLSGAQLAGGGLQRHECSFVELERHASGCNDEKRAARLSLDNELGARISERRHVSQRYTT